MRHSVTLEFLIDKPDTEIADWLKTAISHAGADPAGVVVSDVGLAKSLRREVRQMQLCLEAKNRALDALHHVWCSGGCETGTHRWTPNTLTEEVVALAERQVARMRMWLETYKRKA